MSSLRLSRAALRARPAAIFNPVQRRGYADAVSDKIKLSLALPHQAIYKSTDVVQVNIPAESGEMGILAQHVPSIEQLKPGLVEIIEESGGSKQFFLSGGFAIVQPNSQLSINAVEGFPIEDFSEEAVKSQLSESQKIASGSGSEQDIAEAKIEVEAPLAAVAEEESTTALGHQLGRTSRDGKEGLRGDGQPPVGTLPRIVHPSVEKEVILRPPIFKDVDTLANPLIEDTKAGKWELLNTGMWRYGMSKTLIVMFMYAQSATKTLRWRYEFQRRISADTALSNISLVCLDPGDMDTGLYS